MSRLVSLAILVTLICGGTAAMAQDASKLGPQPAEIEKEGKVTGDLALRTVYTFATCVLHRHRPQVLKWLALPADDPTLTRKAEDFLDDECLMNGMLGIPPILFRGALYAALYRQQFGEKPPALTPAASPVAAGNNRPSDRAFGMLFAFADCVARRDPADVRTMVLSAPGTTKEDEALASLSPQFPLCLVNDAKLQLNKAVLSGMLAEALYNLSIAPAPAVTAGVSH